MSFGKYHLLTVDPTPGYGGKRVTDCGRTVYYPATKPTLRNTPEYLCCKNCLRIERKTNV